MASEPFSTHSAGTDEVVPEVRTTKTEEMLAEILARLEEMNT